MPGRLGAFRPAEHQTLGMIAVGYSYREACEIARFSYANVDRCASEGRAAQREMWTVS